jgi:sialate O-acetylesterase
MDMNRPGNCYASMIAPISGLAVKGAIWHQGYNNAMEPEGHVLYRQVFPKMIAAWRSAFVDPQMPFGIISLCTDGAPQNLDNYLEMMVNEGIYIREVQYQTFLDLSKAGDKNIGFASSFDMRRSWYHPGLKVPVGERIARWALATQYGERIDWRPPVITGMKAGEGRITLSFDIPVTGLRDWPIEGFAIAGADRRFQPATAEHLVTGKDRNNRPTQDQKTVVLTSPHVSNPVHFRYAWGRNPMGNLIPMSTKSRAPLATQRSDDWRIHEVPVKFGDQADRGSLNQARQANRMFDVQRRLKDARHLLDTQQGSNAKAIEDWNAKWKKQN